MCIRDRDYKDPKIFARNSHRFTITMSSPQSFSGKNYILEHPLVHLIRSHVAFSFTKGKRILKGTFCCHIEKFEGDSTKQVPKLL